MAKQPPVDAPATEPEAIEAHNAKLNLYQRIHAIMGDVRRLQKDKQVGGGTYAYKAVSEEKVVTALREAMLRHGVIMFPIEQQHSLVDYLRPGRNGESTLVSLSTVDVRYKLANVDKMDEFEIIASSGTGVDPQDKGVGKAMTYSFKYALLRTFMIPTGADPDDVHNEELQEQQAQRPVAQQQAPAAPIDYATASQKERINELLLHPAITQVEQTKIRTNLNALSHDQAAATIKTLTKWTTERVLAE